MDDRSRLTDEYITVHGERHVVSFLVRCWLEPREIHGGTPPLRGYLRHLDSGEEHYFSDLETIAEYVLGQLRGEATRPAGQVNE